MNAEQTLWQYDWTQKGCATSTFKEYVRQLARFETWYGKPLLSASHADCTLYLVHRLQVSPDAAMHSWRAMRSYYGFVAELDGSPNPMGTSEGTEST